MALPMDTAAVRFDHTADNATPSKLTATSQTPRKATVEDYFSDDKPGLQNVRTKRDDLDEPTEPRKPIIGNNSLPKRVNVSWSHDTAWSNPQARRSSVSHDRASRLSEALTVVPSNADDYDHVPARRRDMRDNLSERERLAKSGTTRRERGSDSVISSDSEQDDDWYRHRGAMRSAETRWPSPHLYMNLATRDDRTLDERAERRQYPAVPYHPDYDPRYHRRLAPTRHQPVSYRDSVMTGETFVEDFAPHDPHPHSRPPLRGYGGYPPLGSPQPPPPPRPQRVIARLSEEERHQADGDLNSTRTKEPAKREKEPAISEAEKTKTYQDFMRSLQQTLDKYKAAPGQVEDKTSTAQAPASPSELTAASDKQPQGPMSDLDLIKLMDARMQALKRKNEEKLIEANQVLAYFDRRSANNQTVSLEPNSVQIASAEVPNVHMFRTPEDETDYDDESDDSESTERDSMAGNSSGSSVLSLESRARRADPSRKVVQTASNREGPREVVESSEDESTDSDDSDAESVISESGSSLSASTVAENDQNDEAREAPARPAPDGRIEHDVMEEVVALRRDLSVLKRQITRKNHSWLGNTLSTAVVKWRKHFRELPRPGTQRLEWICECGDEMYADLPVENGAQYQQMLEFLTRPGPKNQASQHQTTPSQLEGGTAQLDYTSLQSSQASFGQGTSPASTIGSGSTYVGSGSSQLPTAQQNDPFARNKYLELCINVGKYETQLAEIQVSSSQSSGAAICTDAHLFRQIYHRYRALRKRTWRRFLYRPAGIKFVHFGVQAGYRVSFFSSDPLPSEDEITAKRYEYCLQPPVPPPIDSRTFLHYFYKHNTHSHSTSAKYVNRLPKKLGESLARSLGADDLLEGWGIHIIEGPNKVAICWALMVVLLASLGVSIGYDYITRSGDSGFAIGQWMVAALTVGLSALYFSLEDDVNSSFD